MELSKKTKHNAATILGFSLTGLWLFIVVAYAAYFNKWAKLNSLELNELGDFIAGVAAPLAFLWLVVAVLVQSKELKLAITEYRAQSNALKGTQQLQTLQMSLSLFQSGMEVLRAIAIDILLQLVSMDEDTPNQSHDAAEKLYTPKQGYSVFKLQQPPTLPQKQLFHPKVRESLDEALSKVAAGDLNAVHALATKLINPDGLEKALSEQNLETRSGAFKEIVSRYERVRNALISDLRATNAPLYLQDIVTHDHAARFGAMLDAVTRRVTKSAIVNALVETKKQD